VVEAGPGVTRVRPGDLAVTMVRRLCPHAHCPACRADRQEFCLTGDYQERGIKESHGFLTELVVDDERRPRAGDPPGSLPLGVNFSQPRGTDRPKGRRGAVRILSAVPRTT